MTFVDSIDHVDEMDREASHQNYKRTRIVERWWPAVSAPCEKCPRNRARRSRWPKWAFIVSIDLAHGREFQAHPARTSLH